MSVHGKAHRSVDATAAFFSLVDAAPFSASSAPALIQHRADTPTMHRAHA